MKNRMRYMFLAFAAAMTMVLSCQSEDLLVPDASVNDSEYVKVQFSTRVPAMEVVKTKAVDPDGEAITKLVMFCFNERGLFVSIVEAETTPQTDLSGTYEVDLPVVTDRVHIVANFHKSLDESDMLGKSESEVLSTMVGSSGMMSYWARVTKGTRSSIKEAFDTDYQTVELIRDHARVTVVDNSSIYSDLAFTAVNTNAFGTVVPFNDGSWEAPSLDNMFVTLPESDIKISGDGDVIALAQRQYQYVFETENTSDDPVCIILRGTASGQTKYYRVMLIDGEGNFIPVMRNFTYQVNIEGRLDYGQDTFDAALTAPASNNVWVSVSDDVKEVSSTEHSLSVKETAIVLGEDADVFNTTHHKYTVYYTLKALQGTLSESDKPVISWLDGNNVAQHTFASSTFTVSADGKTGEGAVEVILFKPDASLSTREGTILIKKGLLERKVNILTISKQSFAPAWITTNIYGGEAGSDVTMMFHVSDNCPEELFPIDVLVSVNDMDVRNASGMVLPIITANDSRYGKDNGIGYKYVLTVNEPGDQRLYLETILKHSQGDMVEVTIEAEHFNPLTKIATFQSSTDSRILINNLRSYVASTPADEYIYYYFVPQKIHAEVEFDAHLGKVVNTPQSASEGITITDPTGKSTHFQYIDPNVDYSTPNVDEFLLYSQNLEHNHDKPAGTEYYFDFYEIDESKWSSTAGRVMGLLRNTNAPGNKGAALHLRTKTPKADEVVRIASNPYGQVSVTTGTKGSLAKENYSTPTSTGTGTYKSCVFELTTFHPFHFSAQVKKGSSVLAGGVEIGSVKPQDESFELSYAPGQSVNVEFDVTSFMSNMTGVTADEQLSVDPFGTSFDIYIDAPTLELDEAAVAAAGLSSKIRKDSSVPGRVIYTVDASRRNERTYFNGSALAADNAKLDLFRKPITDDYGASVASVVQTGERKVIPFKTKQIVSAGSITLSSDESKVVYYSKTFNINNTPMTGVLTYGTSETPIPEGTFIPFSTEDGTRIAVVTVRKNGIFELRLRAEYDFTWNDSPVKFEAKIADVEYKAEFASLSELAMALTSAINLN
ncbi:MAG: hypothetical protein IKY95_07545 [Bacteroidales bacterium]|nr:hypothetical protein [Bacteroidales bacterium]